ncbi:hypothetical protein EV183_001005, partial [Coemansia sp. RSA 2336]
MKYGLFDLFVDEDSTDAEYQPLPRPKTSKRSSNKVRSTSTWKQYARRSLGTPFPASLPVSKPNDRGLKVKVLSVDASQSVRSAACMRYARPIQNELAETQAFLSQLTISASTKRIDLTSDITDTLKRVEQLRADYKQQKKAKAEAEAEAAAKQQADAKKQAEAKQQADAKQQAEAKEQAEAKQQAETSSVAKPPSHASKYREMYAKMMSELAPRIKANPTHKSYCFKQRGLITRGVGQLKDSWEFIIRTADNIKAILAECESPDVLQWMLNLVAKTMVKQAEREVSVAHHAAYPLAATAVLVMQQYPQLIDMLMVRWVKKCPFVVPEYISAQQSTDVYLKLAGYKRNEDNELESEGIYSERMSGMLALFAAIVQTPDIGVVLPLLKDDGSVHKLTAQVSLELDVAPVNLQGTNSFTAAVEFSGNDYPFSTISPMQVTWDIDMPFVEVRHKASDITLQFLDPLPLGFRVQFMGTKFDIDVLSPRQHKLMQFMKEKEQLDTSKMVLSPMPGTIVSVAVKPGDVVSEGMQVAVVEAMKMQNVLRAPQAGTIKAVH